MDKIAKLQGNRLNEQRSSIRSLPGLRTNNDEVLDLLVKSPGPDSGDNEDFFDMLMKCQVRFELVTCVPLIVRFELVTCVPLIVRFELVTCVPLIVRFELVTRGTLSQKLWLT